MQAAEPEPAGSPRPSAPRDTVPISEQKSKSPSPDDKGEAQPPPRDAPPPHDDASDAAALVVAAERQPEPESSERRRRSSISPSRRDRDRRRNSRSPGRKGDRERSDRHRRSSGRSRSRSRSRDRRRRHRRSRSRTRSRSRSRSREDRHRHHRRRRRRSYSRSRSRDGRSRRGGGSEALPYAKPAADLGAQISLPVAGGTSGAPLLIAPTMPFMPSGVPINPMRPNIPVRMPRLQPGVPLVNPATRSQRRLYVGGIPNPCIDTQLSQFLSSTLLALGLVTSPSGNSPIWKCDVTPERGFAFVEFTEIADCTACVHLDGIIFNGQPLKIKRPKDFVPSVGHVEPQPLGPVAIATLLAQKTGQPLPAELVAAATASGALPPMQ